MNKDSAVILSILSLCNLLPIVLPLLLPFLFMLSIPLHILSDDELSAANIQGFDRKERPPMVVELLNDDEEDTGASVEEPSRQILPGPKSDIISRALNRCC